MFIHSISKHSKSVYIFLLNFLSKKLHNFLKNVHNSIYSMYKILIKCTQFCTFNVYKKFFLCVDFFSSQIIESVRSVHYIYKPSN